MRDGRKSKRIVALQSHVCNYFGMRHNFTIVFDAAESTNAFRGPCNYIKQDLSCFIYYVILIHPANFLHPTFSVVPCRKRHFLTSLLCLIERLSCIGVDKKALSTFPLRSCSLVTLARSMSSLSAGTLRASVRG